MKENYKVITLCGSTKFKNEFMEVQKRLTLEGNIVISVGAFGHSGDDEVFTENMKEMLDDMHKRKIDMSDEIFVINKDGYIGNSTKSEIQYALDTGKDVKYLVDTNRFYYSEKQATLHGRNNANAVLVGENWILYSEWVSKGFMHSKCNWDDAVLVYETVDDNPKIKILKEHVNIGFMFGRH